MNKITTEEIQQLAAEFGIDWRLIKMIILVESSNAGFGKDGRIIIRFEERKFQDKTGLLVTNKHMAQSDEWESFNKAYGINADAANLSTSWGMAQIMGESFKWAGYDSADRMIGEFKISEFYQVKGMLNFCKNKPGLWAALKAKDYAKIELLYNGGKKGVYATRLQNAYSKFV
jgi:hypothetical protein